MHNELPVSNREFARMVGQSEGAVRKAIARESIKSGLVDVAGKRMILPSVAAAEWGKDIVCDVKDKQVDDSGAATSLPVPDVEPLVEVVKAPAPVVDLPEDETIDEVTIDPNDPIEDAELRKKIPAGITKAEADRRLSVLKARKAQLELDELEGSLVDKQLVFQNLAEMGMIIRDTFMNLPARHLDEIVAADSRNERMILFENAIANALNGLVNLDNPKFERK